MTAPRGADRAEAGRLAELDRYRILDTGREVEFDEVTRLAAEICGAPIALVSLVAADRQWFKAEQGLGLSETPLSQSVCAVAIRESGLFVVPDLADDARFCTNPIVTEDPHLRFYAGARLDTPDGIPLGTLCVLDTSPRPDGLTDKQSFALGVLARQVMSNMQLRRSVAERDEALRGREIAEAALLEANRKLELRLAESAAHGERLETEVRQAAENFRLLVHAVSDYAVYMLDPAGTVTSWNSGGERIKGYCAEEIVGQNFSRFFTEEDRAGGRPARALGIALQEGRYEEEGWRVRKDGGRFWASVLIDAIRGEDGRHIGFAKVTRDITERRNTELALEQARKALFQSQKMEAVGQLTGGIAHDFNNLLTGIVGSLDVMRTRIGQGRTEHLGRYVEAAIGSAQRAAALTHRLLAFARRQPLDPKAVNANTLVSGLEDLFRRTISESIALRILLASNLWPTLCDPHQLENAVLNLVINSRDAMPDGGTLTVETRNVLLDEDYAVRNADVTPGEYVCIRVTDTGVGMGPEVIGRAFDPFFTTKPIGQGTGLGLSMIYGFARQSEGHARIESEPGLGTTVSIYLPRGQQAAEEGATERNAAPPMRKDRGETVLVVEDEPVVRGLVVEALEELGYRAVQAADGPAGLAVLESPERIDLLVTDVGLPGMNGRQLADRARAMRPDLKILFVTGYAEGATMSAGSLAPGMELLTKPFQVDALTKRISDMVEEGRTS